MNEISPWLEIAKLIIKEGGKKRDIPPVDPAEIAKCVKELQIKLIEEKAVLVKNVSGYGKIEEKLLQENIRRITDNMTLSVERKKAILKIPISKETYTYEFKW